MKWKAASAKYRQDIARAMVAATPPLIVGRPPATDLELRSAMNNWGFNTKRRADAPAEVAERLRWLSENTRPLRDLADPGVAREVLEAATSRLDGQRAAPDTVRKHRMLLSNAMDYAVELELLDTNPIKAIKWRAPTTSTTREVDRRSVVNHRQARALLEAVKSQEPSGPRLVAFFALMYYSALRPEEAVNLDRDHIVLPPASRRRAWGELHLTSAAPHAGRHWTNDGALRETRALKHRIEGESRTVPIPPQLVAILRSHLAEFPDGPDGRLFYGVRSESTAVDDVHASLAARPARPPSRHVSRRPRSPAGRTTFATPASRPGSTPASPPHRSPPGPATASTCSSRSTPRPSRARKPSPSDGSRPPSRMAWVTKTTRPTSVRKGSAACEQSGLVMPPRSRASAVAAEPPSSSSAPTGDPWHVCGTDTRRTPVSAGHSRTTQKGPRPAFPLARAPSERGTPDRIRTGATALRGRRARPLHNGGLFVALSLVRATRRDLTEASPANKIAAPDDRNRGALLNIWLGY